MTKHKGKTTLVSAKSGEQFRVVDTVPVDAGGKSGEAISHDPFARTIVVRPSRDAIVSISVDSKRETLRRSNLAHNRRSRNLAPTS